MANRQVEFQALKPFLKKLKDFVVKQSNGSPRSSKKPKGLLIMLDENSHCFKISVLEEDNWSYDAKVPGASEEAEEAGAFESCELPEDIKTTVEVQNKKKQEIIEKKEKSKRLFSSMKGSLKMAMDEIKNRFDYEIPPILTNTFETDLLERWSGVNDQEFSEKIKEHVEDLLMKREILLKKEWFDLKRTNWLLKQMNRLLTSFLSGKKRGKKGKGEIIGKKDKNNQKESKLVELERVNEDLRKRVQELEQTLEIFRQTHEEEIGFKKAKEALEKELDFKSVMFNPSYFKKLAETNKNQAQIVEAQGFSEENIKKIPNLDQKFHICFSQGGIARKPASNDFATLGIDGTIVLFDGVAKKEKKRVKIKVKNSQKWGNNNLDFSPNGKLLLVSVCGDNRIQVLYGEDLVLVPDSSWNSKKTKLILKAKWIRENIIVACFSSPGKLVFFQVGNKNPIWKIQPKETIRSSIVDIDFYPWEEYVYCGSDKMVLKIDYTSRDSQTQLVHRGHGDFVTAVCVSPDGRFVLSASLDSKVILASSKGGGTHSVFEEFSDPSIYGLIFHPSGKMAFASSYNELVALKIQVKEREVRLEKTGEIHRINSGNKRFSGLNGFWEKGPRGEGPFLLLGNEEGKLFKCLLK